MTKEEIQDALLGFVRNMHRLPREIRLIHGDPEASEALAQILRETVANTLVASR